MTNDRIPEKTSPVAPRTARPLRTTPDLISELQGRATALTLAAIAVVNNDITRFVFAIDDDPLDKLNGLIRTGGHPIGIVGARIWRGTVEYHHYLFVEYQHHPQALALQTLRAPFLALMRTHVDRMPKNPRNN